ncbi:inhibitor of nuclear factor kappa-B kinase subunit epsilon-like isoform X2 [Pomacea canaliculata]|nr:inhibitor of nuclear factor kappa-B kinase subunit epsilon-like isoform X2 [Pomacea canaliculata]
MEHLRSHGFVHRDIKPGNILRQIDEEGKSIFKLSDFGTARPLGDDEYFKSIVGTPDFLHPEIFNVAFGITDTDKSIAFPHNVDLWSLGVTIYCAATGSVPFSPHKHESKPTTMFEMISQKPSGAIGARQKEARGEIQWIFALPNTCHLSRGLKKLLLPMLVALFERDPALGWTFERFFQESKNILEKERITYLSLLPSQPPFDEIFISRSPGFSYNVLKEQLSNQQTEHGMSELHDILHGDISLTDWPQEDEQEFIIPPTDINSPLILLPATVPLSFDGDDNLFRETSITYTASGVILPFLKICAIIILIHRCVVNLKTLQQHLWRLTERQIRELKKEVQAAEKTFYLMTELFDVIRGTANMAEWTNQENSNFKEILQKMSSIERTIEAAKSAFRESPGKHHLDFDGTKCAQLTQRAQEEAQSCIEEMEGLRRTMERAKFTTRHQESYFEALRKKLEGAYKRAQNVWQEQGPHKGALLRLDFLAWYRSHLQLHENVQKCHEDLATVAVLVGQLFKSCVNRASKGMQDTITKRMHKSLLNSEQGSVSREQFADLLTGLQDLTENLEAPEIFSIPH